MDGVKIKPEAIVEDAPRIEKFIKDELGTESQRKLAMEAWFEEYLAWHTRAGTELPEVDYHWRRFYTTYLPTKWGEHFRYGLLGWMVYVQRFMPLYAPYVFQYCKVIYTDESEEEQKRACEDIVFGLASMLTCGHLRKEFRRMPLFVFKSKSPVAGVVRGLLAYSLNPEECPEASESLRVRLNGARPAKEMDRLLDLAQSYTEGLAEWLSEHTEMLAAHRQDLRHGNGGSVAYRGQERLYAIPEYVLARKMCGKWRELQRALNLRRGAVQAHLEASLRDSPFCATPALVHQMAVLGFMDASEQKFQETPDYQTVGFQTGLWELVMKIGA